jgi:hypothetical protein
MLGVSAQKSDKWRVIFAAWDPPGPARTATIETRSNMHLPAREMAQRAGQGRWCCSALGPDTHARLRTAPVEPALRGAAPFMSSATLRRNASMRLMMR